MPSERWPTLYQTYFRVQIFCQNFFQNCPNLISSEMQIHLSKGLVFCCSESSLKWERNVIFQSLKNFDVFIYFIYYFTYFIYYRTRVRSLAMLVTNWLPNWLTHSLPFSQLDSDHCLPLSLTHWLTFLFFSKLEWCDSGMWRWQLKTCWSCYCCWYWWWETCWQQFGADLEGEIWS